MAVTRLDMLRHGACEGGEIFRGSTDVPLSELGWQQMRDTVASVGEPRWQRIVSSPLQRCARFAEEQSRLLQLPLEFDDALREMHFGDWEGLPHSEAERRYPQEWRQFWQSPAEASPPSGEAMGDFCQRVCTALDSLQQRYSGESVLLVIHGAVIRVMMCHLLGMPMGAMTRLAVPYACLSRFSVYQLDGHDPWVQLHKHG
ncbi:alpha-ribazole phosphatase [Spongiibacter sp. KMU-166]|uniref:Alpha-ribazole phosphatase n=1 Tax=Spongiibacter thalassae TaxID=2721624 RepID=A0ABX1GIW4_9GAMM|nr:alpha-ribazole phosphatase [Spongiibacter thalassae]NKI18856.1 alpha-ribazole phosphatase [Spongiibacter thalassae]